VLTDSSNNVEAIDLGLIFIPEGIKKNINFKTEKNVVLMDSFHRRQVNPINVRPIETEKGKRYELVCGQRRYGAAKRLGHKKILCKIEPWTDKEIEYFRMVENVHRTQLTPSQEAKANQMLLKAFGEMFGEDPGRAAGGIARARDAVRDGGKFEQAASNEGLPESPTFPPPATEIMTVAGEVANVASIEEVQVKAFSTLLSEATGKSKRMSTDDALIAKKIKPDELEQLEAVDLTRDTLLKIAKIKDENDRSRVVCLVAFGDSFDDAVKQVKEKPDEVPPQTVHKAEHNMTDAEWLSFHCDEFRSNLQNPHMFDQDAILYRVDKTARTAHRTKSQDAILEVRLRRWTPLSDLLSRSLFVKHPSEWQLCPECMGRNDDKSDCKMCVGCGYKVQYEVAKRVAKD
jgi:hypothetical protein